MPHTDGERYDPLVATLSLSSAAVLIFSERLRTEEIGKREPQEIARFLLQPRSLFVFAGSLYTDCLHRIDAVLQEEVGDVVNALSCQDFRPDTKINRRKRVSLTFRRLSGT